MKMPLIILILIATVFWLYSTTANGRLPDTGDKSPDISTSPSSTPLPTPLPVPAEYLLTGGTHTFQTFNNCGPASLSMALSYYSISVTQKEIGDRLRPWQNPQGDNDDKSVTLEELAQEARRYGFTAYYRPGGDKDQLKGFISLGLPVITRTWLKADDDIGHYRVVKGYGADGIIQDDSLQGKDLRYTWAEFDAIWSKFNYEYVVLVPAEKVDEARAVLGENIEESIVWKKAAAGAGKAYRENPLDVSAGMNHAVALYRMGEYEQSAEIFSTLESRLPKRALWYQIEPIKSLYELGRDDDVFRLTDSILGGGNRAFSELYIIRGKVYKRRGDISLARAEFEKAVTYNPNLPEAHAELESVRGN